MRRRTAALSLVAAALVVAFAGWLFLSRESPAARAGGPPPPLVEIAEATVQVMELTARAVGSVEAAESIVVSSPVTGIVERLNFAEGERVEAGAPLVELDAAAELAALEGAQAELQDARKQWQRLAQLAGSGAVSRSSLDEARARMATARARVDEGEARLEERRITAPFAGTVGLAQVSPGAVIQPGDPIASLATVARLKLAFRLPTQTVPRLRPGLEVRATAPGIEGQFTGRVSRIDNTVDEATRSIALEAALPETAPLKPGMFVTVEVILDTFDAIVVPEAAVLLEGNQAFVYEVGADRIARRRPVTIGERRSGIAQVREGLAAGSRVVVAGEQKVIPGRPVTFAEGSGAPPEGAP